MWRSCELIEKPCHAYFTQFFEDGINSFLPASFSHLIQAVWLPSKDS